MFVCVYMCVCVCVHVHMCVSEVLAQAILLVYGILIGERSELSLESWMENVVLPCIPIPALCVCAICSLEMVGLLQTKGNDILIKVGL